MPAYSETRILPYSPIQLFELVLDIEKYPEFLPWCRGARIVSRETTAFVGELVISFSHLTERYTSRITPIVPTDKTEGSIHVNLVKGPFSHLSNHWRFMPHTEGTELYFQVDFAFKSSLLDKMIGGLFTRATEKMIGAFTARAEALYK